MLIHDPYICYIFFAFVGVRKVLSKHCIFLPRWIGRSIVFESLLLHNEPPVLVLSMYVIRLAYSRIYYGISYCCTCSIIMWLGARWYFGFFFKNHNFFITQYYTKCDIYIFWSSARCNCFDIYVGFLCDIGACRKMVTPSCIQVTMLTIKWFHCILCSLVDT